MTKAVLALSSDLSKTEEKALHTHLMSMPERTVNGLKGAALYIVFAGLALAIPGLHLLLVPIFLMAAAYRFVDEYMNDVAIDKTEFTCFDCGKKFAIKNEALNWPVRVDCPHCQAHYRMDPKD